MKMPLALVSFENLVRGNQLLNKLRDLGYRVDEVSTEKLPPTAEKSKPLLVILEVVANSERALAAMKEIRGNPETTHIPVLAVSSNTTEKFANQLRESGATLVASNAALLEQLPQLLDHVLEVE